MQLSLLNWLLAFSPVLAILVLMLALRWSATKAGVAGWLVALIVSSLAFGAGPRLVGYAQVKGLLLALDVLYIIWMALLLFHVADEAGAIRIIGERLPQLTPNRMMQGLLLGWVFASFLQGMGGYGVPVAVVAPILVQIGFGPVQAVIMSSAGHGWAVTFGSLATSFQAAIAATNVPGEDFAAETAILLAAAAFFCGAIVAYTSSGWKAMLRGLPAIIALTVVMGSVQYLLVTNHLWTLGSTVASLAGLIVGMALSRLPLYQHADVILPEQEASQGPATAPTLQAADPGPQRSLWIALSGYAVLITLTLLVNLVPALDELFNQVKLSLNFPELVTGLGWSTEAEAGRRISLFGHPGAILFYASSAAYLIYHRVGYYRPGALRRIGTRVLKSAVGASLGIVAMVGMAVIMSHAGMTNLIAQGISEGVGAVLFPPISPFIGVLGAFMTGSATNSNVVFSALQQQTAQLLSLSIPLILAAQVAGSGLGSVLAPTKLIVGCSTVGLNGQEYRVIGQMLIYGLIPIVVVALLVWLLAVL